MKNIDNILDAIDATASDRIAKVAKSIAIFSADEYASQSSLKDEIIRLVAQMIAEENEHETD